VRKAAAAAGKMEGKHLSIIVDNMDQAKSRLPSFAAHSKTIIIHVFRVILGSYLIKC